MDRHKPSLVAEQTANQTHGMKCGFMNQPTEISARQIFRAEWEQLTLHESQVIEDVLHRISIVPDRNNEFRVRRTFGERVPA